MMPKAVNEGREGDSEPLELRHPHGPAHNGDGGLWFCVGHCHRRSQLLGTAVKEGEHCKLSRFTEITLYSNRFLWVSNVFLDRMFPCKLPPHVKNLLVAKDG